MSRRSFLDFIEVDIPEDGRLNFTVVRSVDENTEGPQGQTLEVETERWDNGNIKVEFQYYRDGGSVIKYGFYKEYDEDGTLRVDGRGAAVPVLSKQLGRMCIAVELNEATCAHTAERVREA